MKNKDITEICEMIEERFGWWSKSDTNLPRMMKIIEFEWRDFIEDVRKSGGDGK